MQISKYKAVLSQKKRQSSSNRKVSRTYVLCYLNVGIPHILIVICSSRIYFMYWKIFNSYAMAYDAEATHIALLSVKGFTTTFFTFSNSRKAWLKA
jgi:hypothetical protein